MKKHSGLISVFAVLFMLAVTSSANADSGMSLVIRGLKVSATPFALFAMPNESVSILTKDITGDVKLHADKGKVIDTGSGWVWKAPVETGLYQLNIRVADLRVFQLNAFVMRSAGLVDDETLDGYEIGEYPDEPLHDLAAYNPPKGFIQLLPNLMDTPLSPNFRLKQFRCKQEGGFPAYAVIQERLVAKLEIILDRLRAKGVQASSLHVMSGYRTPEYNDDIGNGDYSRHIYGDAADIFVDENPKDRRMDDLNGDGVVNYRDAHWLAQVIEEVDADPAYQHLIGGLGIYTSNDYHGPFVHVDARGFKTRWNN